MAANNTTSPAPNVYSAASTPLDIRADPYNGVGLDQLTPDQLALGLGLDRYVPGYNPNQQGSGETSFDQVLNRLTPQQLIERYSQGNPAQFRSSQDQAQYQAYQNFNSLFGRNPTANELSQIMPAFQGPNGMMNGRAFLATLQNQYKANPLLDPTNAQNNLKPGDIQGQVSQQFQSILGRAPTSDELSHFTQAIQTGQTDAYGLGSFLKQMPEYTNAQDAQFRQGLNTELQGYDTTEFNKEKGDIISQFAQNGTLGSSGLDYALTDLMGNIAQNRSAYLAQLSASQYGGNKSLATQNYQNTLDQMYQNNQAQRQQQNAYSNSLLDRGYNGADYETQKNDYMNFLGQQPKQSNNAFSSTLMGAGALAPLGPWGAAAGGAAGLFSYLNQR